MALSKRADITKVQLTVTAKNVALLLGNPVPEAFELTYDGFVYDEDVAKAFYVNSVLKITTATGIDDNSLSDIRVYSENGAICVANNKAAETVKVYTTQGVKVYEGTDNVISTNIDKGVIVIRVGSSVTKIVVR